VTNTVLNPIQIVLNEQGEPQSPYWLASLMNEQKFWKASEHDVRVALEKDRDE
jgi:hypothetical protein